MIAHSTVASAETVVRCYVFVARLHVLACRRARGEDVELPIRIATGTLTDARREMARRMFTALLTVSPRTRSALLREARTYAAALRAMWAEDLTHDEWARASAVHDAAEMRLFDAEAAS